jgi:acyl-CoA thioesterase
MNDDSGSKAKAVYHDFQSMTGLEFLQKALASGDKSPMHHILNFSVHAVEDGMVQIKAVPTEKFYNPMLRIHGGFTASLIDTALGSAVLTKLPKGTGCGTVSLNISYVRKIDVSTGPLIATANVLHAGRTMLTAEAKVADASGVLYAHGTGTFLVYPK